MSIKIPVYIHTHTHTCAYRAICKLSSHNEAKLCNPLANFKYQPANSFKPTLPQSQPSTGPVFENQFRIVVCLCPNLLTASICFMYTYVHIVYIEIYIYICLIIFYLIPDFSSNFISCLLNFLTFVFVRCH